MQSNRNNPFRDLLITILRQKYVILTSRSGYFDNDALKVLEFNNSEAISTLQVTGFSSENIKKYVTDYFTNCRRPKLGETLKSHLEGNNTAKNLVNTPLNLKLLCEVWHSEYSSQNRSPAKIQTMPGLYDRVTELWLKRYLQRPPHDPSMRLTETKIKQKKPSRVITFTTMQFSGKHAKRYRL